VETLSKVRQLRGVRLLLVAAVWMATLGLINIFVLSGGTVGSAFFFAGAAVGVVVAFAEFVLARLIQRSVNDEGNPS
jgi:hypothetical protein